MSTNSKKLNNVEFLRFVFSLVIVYFHIFHTNILEFVSGNATYLRLSGLSDWAQGGVECFVVIAGYFLCVSVTKHKDRSFIRIFFDRLFRLWPAFAFALLISFLFFDMKTDRFLYELTMINFLGIKMAFRGVLWFVPPFFWSSILLVIILKIFKSKNAATVISIIAAASCIVYSLYSSDYFSRDAYGMLPLGFIRILSSMAIGVLIAMIVKKKTLSHNVILWTIIEVVSLAMLIKMMFFGNKPFNNIYFVTFFFSLVFISFVTRSGALAKLFDYKAFGVLGKYSYSIYLMQQISFNLLAKTFWTNTSFLNDHVVLTVIISILFATAVGILTYYLIENPIAKLCRKIQEHK